jgi:hypothetical protein
MPLTIFSINDRVRYQRKSVTKGRRNLTEGAKAFPKEIQIMYVVTLGLKMFVQAGLFMNKST